MLTGSPVDPEPASKLNPGRPTRQARVICTLVVGSNGQAATQHSKSSSSRPCRAVRAGPHFRGQGKRGKIRFVPVHAMAQRLIEEYQAVGHGADAAGAPCSAR